ncbi:MAG TPA: 50S ribosomal protein L11 methyltransferase [Candidatus Sulfotelmatobacter sp.]|nr:50S ribosomal protein L11 methyltransferase [Candidatus Sulfotelmatobacter sp.]
MRSFCALRLRVPPAAAGAVANFLLEQGAPGLVEETPRGARAVALTAPFDSRARGEAAARALRRLLRALRRLGTLRGRTRITLRAVRGSAWAERWRRYARPVRIGRRLVVQPSWVRAPADGAARVTLDPGMAFGTGAHATTRLCLEALARHVRGRERVLDLGTGSGVLAIAAAKLGAGEIVALDTDPVACRVARENSRRNRVGRRVRVRHGPLAACGARGFDLAVANLTARDLAEVLPGLARRVRPGGLLVVSGLLRGQASAARRAAHAAGFGPVTARRRGEWVALEARRIDPETPGRGDTARRRHGKR